MLFAPGSAEGDGDVCNVTYAVIAAKASRETDCTEQDRYDPGGMSEALGWPYQGCVPMAVHPQAF